MNVKLQTSNFKLILFSVLFVITACKRDHLDDSPAGSSFQDVATSNRDALSESALNDVITADYEFYGNTLREHLKYRFTTTQPEIYLGPTLAQPFKQKLAEISAAEATKPISEKLAYLQTIGMISSNTVSKFNDWENVVSQYDEVEQPNFGEIWYELKTFEQNLVESTSMTYEEKEPVLALSSLFRNHLKHQYELGQFADDRGGCFLGIKMECWKNAFLTTILDALKAGLGSYIGQEFGSNPIDWKKVKQITYTAGGVGAIINVAKLYTVDNGKCKCDENSTGSDPCAPPLNLSLSYLGDCNPLEQYVVVSGQGSAASGYTFTAIGGTFPDFGNVSFVTIPIPTIKVRQTDPNVPVSVGVVVGYSSTCLGGTSPLGFIAFNIPALVNGVGTVAVSGSKTITFGDPTNFEYRALGTWLADPNALITQHLTSFHGTITATGVDFLKVLWTTQTNQYLKASASIVVKNICSNQIKTAGCYPITIE